MYGEQLTACKFMKRLARNTAGNTLAIMAAAFFPLAGLIGGGVDLTRIYITKTRLQQACDAGALAGRKTMGAGAWSTGGTTSSQAHANQLFSANFDSGDFGTEALTKAYTESNGTVTGTASVVVPMTLMRLFDKPDHEVEVTCTAKMEIPNTDVMFVLDVTFSMECQPSDGALGCNTTGPVATRRISGLRTAVFCFYEALLKVNTATVCGNDPTATAYTGTAQVRLGFVPYGSNVNVGRLLPTTFIADSWTYQTRVANTDNPWGYTLGTVSSTNWGAGWSAAPTVATLQNASGYSSWSTISGSGNVNINGTNRAKTVSLSAGTTNCNTPNIVGTSPNKMVDYVDPTVSSSPTLTGTTNNPPTHTSGTSPSSQTLSYTESQTHNVTGYRYLYDSSPNPDVCRLQSGTRSYAINRSGTATRPITWTQYTNRFLSWDYKQSGLNVAGLKSGTNWNAGVALPLALGSSQSVTLSGNSSATSIQQVTNTTVAWEGCIEERRTHQTTDGNPIGEWDPVPANANDLDIDDVPNAGNANTLWGAQLPNATWGRYTGSDPSNNWTQSTVTTTTDFTDRNFENFCPTVARNLDEYVSAADTTSFVGYINSLTAVSRGTYHDIGMLWGARLLSPTGIFAADNAFTPEGGAIERNLIFMTDGSTQTATDNLYAYGMPWWSRRQITGVPTTTNLDNIVNERLVALCTRIKNMNINLWVISYGAGVNAANKTRLQNCASPGKFYDAANTATLISNFQQIASEIADLRLTT